MVAKKATVKNNRVTPSKNRGIDVGVQGGPTSAAEWKKKSTVGTPIRVPSGNVALVRRPGMQVFLSKGMIPNSLMGFVNDSLKSGKPKVEDLNMTPETLKELMNLVDDVTCDVCIDPMVVPKPKDHQNNILPMSSRDPNTLYVDEVDVEDKMFIFNYAVGGTADVDSFRKEFATAVVDVQTSKDVGL